MFLILRAKLLSHIAKSIIGRVQIKGAMKEKKELGNQGPEIRRINQAIIPNAIPLARDVFLFAAYINKIIATMKIESIIFGKNGIIAVNFMLRISGKYIKKLRFKRELQICH